MSKPEVLCSYCQHKSECFEQLNAEELLFANNSKVQLRYKKGETITKQGSFVTHVIYVRKGLVKVYKEHNRENNVIYDVLPAGSLIGLSNLYFSETFQYSIAALTDTAVCSIDRQVFERVIKDNGSFASSVLEAVNGEIHHLRNKMVSLTQKQLKGKLADTFIYLAENVFYSHIFTNKLSRNDLAEFSGMSMMSVVRTIQEFIRVGYLEEAHGKIKILDMNVLKKISQETG